MGTACITEHPDSLLKRCSSLAKFIRVVAYLLRFKNNATRKNTKKIGQQEAEEIEKTKLVLIKTTQTVYFSNELLDLERDNGVSLKSKLYRLRPFWTQTV